MAQILVVTTPRDDDGTTIVYREQINPSDLESEHFSGQLVERVGWAVGDADALDTGPTAAFPPRPPERRPPRRPGQDGSATMDVLLPGRPGGR